MLSKLDKQPLDAVLAGLIMIIGFVASHSDIEVEGIDWVEPVLVGGYLYADWFRKVHVVQIPGQKSSYSVCWK